MDPPACVTGPAVLEFGPAETLSPVGAMSPAYARLCGPRPSHGSHTREKSRGLRRRRTTSRERQTVRWREMDSNFQYRGKIGSSFEASVALGEAASRRCPPPRAAYAFLRVGRAVRPKGRGKSGR